MSTKQVYGFSETAMGKIPGAPSEPMFAPEGSLLSHGTRRRGRSLPDVLKSPATPLRGLTRFPAFARAVSAAFYPIALVLGGCASVPDASGVKHGRVAEPAAF